MRSSSRNLSAAIRAAEARPPRARRRRGVRRAAVEEPAREGRARVAADAVADGVEDAEEVRLRVAVRQHRGVRGGDGGGAARGWGEAPDAAPGGFQQTLGETFGAGATRRGGGAGVRRPRGRRRVLGGRRAAPGRAAASEAVIQAERPRGEVGGRRGRACGGGQAREGKKLGTREGGRRTFDFFPAPRTRTRRARDFTAGRKRRRMGGKRARAPLFARGWAGLRLTADGECARAAVPAVAAATPRVVVGCAVCRRDGRGGTERGGRTASGAEARRQRLRETPIARSRGARRRRRRASAGREPARATRKRAE